MVARMYDDPRHDNLDYHNRFAVSEDTMSTGDGLRSMTNEKTLADLEAENAALLARVYELEARLFSLTCKSCGNRLRSFYCPTCGKPMSRTVSTKETRDVADYDGEGIA